jgi:hypothetical protein
LVYSTVESPSLIGFLFKHCINRGGGEHDGARWRMDACECLRKVCARTLGN